MRKQDCGEIMRTDDRTYQTFTVQEGGAPGPGCGPFGESDDMIQVSGKIADVLLLSLQDTLMILCYSLQSMNK